MELFTRILTRPEIQEEVGAIADFLHSQGKQSLLVSYGWDCDLEPEELFQEKTLPLSNLSAFLAQSEED